MGTQLQMINISLRTLQLPFVINRNIPWQKKEQILISLGIEVIIKIFIFLATNKAGSLKSFDTGIINSFLQKNLDYDLKIQQTELAFRIWCAFSIVLQRNMRLQNTSDIKFSVYIHSEREAKHFLLFPHTNFILLHIIIRHPYTFEKFSQNASSFMLQLMIIMILCILLTHCTSVTHWQRKDKPIKNWQQPSNHFILYACWT